jgi:hypothetical protein
MFTFEHPTKKYQKLELMVDFFDNFELKLEF